MSGCDEQIIDQLGVNAKPKADADQNVARERVQDAGRRSPGFFLAFIVTGQLEGNAVSKFNKALTHIQKALAQRGPDTLNRAGGLAYQDTPRIALYRQIATSLWSGDGYYEKKAEWFQRFQANVAAALDEDVRFPFALAAYARDKLGLALRASPIALYAKAVAHPASKGTGVVPHGMLRGIQDALRNFDEYQLAKYKDPGAVSMRDVLRLARPKPKDDHERALWRRVVSRSLETPYTWEVELSKCVTDEEKRAKWNELIRSGKLGLFALVRNIRNIVKYGADVEEALSQIMAERVKGSGILPFQWYKAYKAIAEAAGEGVAEPMQQALEWSLADVPKLSGGAGRLEREPLPVHQRDGSRAERHRAHHDPLLNILTGRPRIQFPSSVTTCGFCLSRLGRSVRAGGAIG